MSKNIRLTMFICFIFGFIFCLLSMKIKSYYCDMECDAQHLYKNKIFHEMRGQFYFDPSQKNIKRSDGLLLKSENLEKSGVRIAQILNESDIILVSKINDLMLVASPNYKDGRITWNCQFFSNFSIPPKGRQCGF